MRVLGFDVGIKNCSYCVVDYDLESNAFTIPEPCEQYWNIINLTETHTLHCANPECDNNVTQTAIVDNIPRYYCGRHKKIHKELLEEIPINIVETDDVTIKCQHSASCKTKSKWIGNGKYLCGTHKTMFERNVTKERELKKYKVFVKDFTVHDLKIILLKKFEELQEIFLNVDVVCIESQPSLKNPTMKAIADVMYTWFLMRSVIDQEYTCSTIKKITFFAPSNKMKINGMEEELNDEINNASNKYKKTKNLGIEQCSRMICNDTECVEHLAKFKKKDDLCDAYLHAVYYIQKELKLKKNNKKGTTTLSI